MDCCEGTVPQAALEPPTYRFRERSVQKTCPATKRLGNNVGHVTMFPLLFQPSVWGHVAPTEALESLHHLSGLRFVQGAKVFPMPPNCPVLQSGAQQ